MPTKYFVSTKNNAPESALFFVLLLNFIRIFNL